MNSDVKCNARAGPGGSLTDCFRAPLTIIRLSFLEFKLKIVNKNVFDLCITNQSSIQTYFSL